MVKKLLQVFILIFCIGIGWSVYVWKTRPTLIAPLTYKIEVDYANKKDFAEEANVLIIGDQLAESLNRFIPKLTNNLSVKLKDPLRIVNWAAANEGLYEYWNRTPNPHQLERLTPVPADSTGAPLRADHNIER